MILLVNLVLVFILHLWQLAKLMFTQEKQQATEKSGIGLAMEQMLTKSKKLLLIALLQKNTDLNNKLLQQNAIPLPISISGGDFVIKARFQAIHQILRRFYF